MTNRERIETLLRKEKPDRVPIWPIAMGFSVLYSGGIIADAYNNPAKSLAAQRKASRDFDWVFFPMMGASGALASELGGEIQWPKGDFSQAPSVTRYPVNSVEDVWKLTLPDVKSAGTIPLRLQFYKQAAQERLDNEPFNVMLWEGGPFTSAAHICGEEKICKWTIKEPAAVHRLMRITLDYYLGVTGYLKEIFGIEGVLPFFGEPTASNQILSPKKFEVFVLPYLKELCDALRGMGYRHIFVHICGEQNLNLPYWSQINFGHPGIISFGHEVELETAARYFPQDIIMGNLNPALVQTRSPQEVYEATRQVVEKGKKLPNGYIFAPGCETPPKAPVENIRAMVKAVNDFGWYR
jgi:uroporphyrinogen decarboxylase